MAGRSTGIRAGEARPAMTRSTVFTTNKSQAVRLPKAVAFPADVHQVEIVSVGHSRIITPVGRTRAAGGRTA
jgi:hypothetical protein